MIVVIILLVVIAALTVIALYYANRAYENGQEAEYWRALALALSVHGSRNAEGRGDRASGYSG